MHVNQLQKKKYRTLMHKWIWTSRGCYVLEEYIFKWIIQMRWNILLQSYKKHEPKEVQKLKLES